MLRDWWYRFVGWIGVVRPMRYVHARVYRWTGGAGPTGRSLGNLTVVLTSIGAKSGQRRETAMWAYPDGDNLVLVASNAGKHAYPGWYHNLRANPDAEVQVRRRVRPVRARVAEGPEYDRLWAVVTGAYPGYVDYLGRAGRAIPLVVLEPLTAGALDAA